MGISDDTGHQPTISDDALVDWIDALEAYAKDWDATFEAHPHYFTQEFWYLFVGITTSTWRGKPVTISTACQMMKTGSTRTREERLKKAVQDGFLIKERGDDDKRTTFVKPSSTLEASIRGHLERTFHRTRSVFTTDE